MSPEFFLGVVFPWLVALFLLILFIVQLILLPSLLKTLFKSSKLFIVLASLALIGGVYVRFTFVPNQHRIFYDEDRYLGYSVSFARFNKTVSTELATPQQSIIGKPDQAVRVTVPVIHGLILKMFGYTEQNLFHTSRIVSLLLAFYTAILAYQLFRSYLTSFLTLLGMLFLPIQVYWSASMALDPYYVFFAIASVVSLLSYLRKPNTITLSFTVACLFLFLCVRIESFIFLPVLAFLFYSVRKSSGKPLFIKEDKLFFTILLPLIFIRGFASISVLGQKWCCAEALPLEAFSFKYITRNLLPNIQYVINGYDFPYFFTLPALWNAIKTTSNKKTFLMLWIGIFFILYSFYYAGSFVTAEFSGSYARYFLILIPAFFLLWGDFITTTLIPFMKKSKRNLIFSIIVVLFFSYQLTTKFWQYHDDVAYVPMMFAPVDRVPIAVHSYLENVFLKRVPKDAIVIHPITAVPLLLGRTIVYYEYFLKDNQTIDFVKQSLQKGKRVFIMNDFECDQLPYRCDRILKTFVTKRSGISPKDANAAFVINEVFLKSNK